MGLPLWYFVVIFVVGGPLGLLVAVFIRLWVRRRPPKPLNPSPLDDSPPSTVGYHINIPKSSQRKDDVERQVERKDMSTVDERSASSTTVVREHGKRAYRGKENGVGNYLNKVLRVLFMVLGLLTIILSVVLDNSYNDEPVRFVPFGILAPFTIFVGFLASGWFPRVPLRLIAILKRHGFLRNVMPCSPWHDNVVTDFSGTICTLQQTDSGTSHLPQVLQTFLYGDQGTVITQSTLALERTSSFHEVSTLNAHLQVINVQDSVPDITATRHGDGPAVMTTGKAPSQVEGTVVQIDQSSIFHVSDDGHSLTLWGPAISGFPLEVQASKNKSVGDSFDVFGTFRNKKTRRMFLDTRRLHNLAQNMLQWVENPYPILVDEFSDILHCMPIQDILWNFTKSLYTLKPLLVEHRFLGCLTWEGVKQYVLVGFLAASSMSGLIPLISDKRSFYFLFLAVPILAYIFVLVTGRLIAHHFRSLLCPLFIRLCGFNELYKCKSFFTWCNEFRKQRVVNPAYFFIEQECANRILDDGESCFNICGVLRVPPNSSSPKESSPILLTCQGRPIGGIQKGPIIHEYKLVVNFGCIQDGLYMDVALSFFESKDLLDSKYFYSSKKITAERLNLVETLFSYYSDPAFGGFVETINPCFRSYLGHCPRFLNVCERIFNEETIPTILIAARKPHSKLVIGGSSYL